MKPTKRVYEQVPVVDDWIKGEIVEIKYEQEHSFVYKGETKVLPSIKFIMELEGCQEKKHSRWMPFGYGERSNLYKIWIEPLVEGAFPNFDFDLDELKGMKIKVMYVQNKEYQNISMVRPLNQKLGFLEPKMKPTTEPELPPIDEEESPPF